jgi:hypothetical protein
MLLYHNKITISRFISIRGPYVLSAHKAGTADARGLAVSCPARGFCRVGLLLDGSRPQGSWIVSEGCAESRHGGDGRRLRSSRLEPTQDCSGMPASTLLVRVLNLLLYVLYIQAPEERDVDRDAAWFDLTAKVENPGRACGAAPAARRLWTVVTYDGVSLACDGHGGGGGRRRPAPGPAYGYEGVSRFTRTRPSSRSRPGGSRCFIVLFK